MKSENYGGLRDESLVPSLCVGCASRTLRVHIRLMAVVSGLAIKLAGPYPSCHLVYCKLWRNAERSICTPHAERGNERNIKGTPRPARTQFFDFTASLNDLLGNCSLRSVSVIL